MYPWSTIYSFKRWMSDILNSNPRCPRVGPLMRLDHSAFSLFNAKDIVNWRPVLTTLSPICSSKYYFVSSRHPMFLNRLMQLSGANLSQALTLRNGIYILTEPLRYTPGLVCCVPSYFQRNLMKHFTKHTKVWVTSSRMRQALCYKHWLNLQNNRPCTHPITSLLAISRTL